jgi:two-component system OmpR family response regulator
VDENIAEVTTASVAVVDDEPSVCRSLARLLRVAGYAVHTFASGAELLESRLLSSIDVVFIDLQMPGPNGLQVAAQLRKDHPQLPIVLMTASEEYETERHRHPENVVDVCLKKPLDSTLALKTIQKCLQRVR